MPLSRAIMWIVILVTLVIGAGLYWFFTREFKGQAAETVNIAHTEALTGSSLGLVGYWTFDGNDIKWSDTTTEIKDTSGNAKHGDAQGSLAAASAVRGESGQALSFNGTSDLVSLGNVYNGVKTVAFWVKPNTTTQSFIDLNGTATINMTTGTVAANNFTSPTICVDGTATSTFPDTNWHHVVVTTGTGINASAVNLGKISSSYFGGILDDVRFYSAALSATQVADLYRASSAKEVDNANHREALTNGLVGYWTFDGRDTKWSDTSTEIKDISGNGNHGNAQGSLATTSVTPGKLGQALSFDGDTSEGYVAITDSGSGSSLDFANGSSITISAWIQPTSFPVSGVGVILSKDTQGSCGYETNYELMWYDGGDLGCVAATCPLRFHYRSSGIDHNFTTDTLGDSVVLGEWQQVVFTSTFGTGSSAKLYRNGQLLSSGAWYSGSGNSAPLQSDQPVWIGAANACGGESVDEEFVGGIDDVRIYSRALSASEVADLYNMGK